MYWLQHDCIDARIEAVKCAVKSDGYQMNAHRIITNNLRGKSMAKTQNNIDNIIEKQPNVIHLHRYSPIF